MLRILGRLAAIAALLSWTITASAASADSTVKILTVGDSITAAGKWQAETCQQITTNTGLTCELTNPAVGGSRCDYWPSRIGALLASVHPNIVTINCGTNDDVNASVYGESATTWSLRSTFETIHAFDPSILIVPSFVQYSDPLIAPDWLLTSEPVTNDRIYSEYMRHQGWFPAIADLQQLPATADYLTDQPDAARPIGYGIHPTDKGYAAEGRIEYNAIAAGKSWPRIDRDCGMYGHRKGYGRPGYTPC